MLNSIKKNIKTLITAAGALLIWNSLALADEVVSTPDYIAILPGFTFPSKAYGTTGRREL